jgi:hypothetical protein
LGGRASINPEILWLEADFGVTQSGGSVSAWADRSANGYSFTQSTAGSRPTLVTNAINGNPVLRFDGGDWLSMATTLLNTSGSTANIYVVSDNRINNRGGLIHTRLSIDGWSFIYNTATTIIYYHTGFLPSPTRSITDKYNLLEVQRNGLSVAMGDSGSLGSPQVYTGFTPESDGTWIGGGGVESNLNGDIAAIVIATSNRAGILAYLQGKYGV